jgi:ATP-dependent phosphofructokinase / diphosphate-dependent phosphofructokinase
MGAQKKIGILTSGGDCAGLNAVIRAVVHCAVGSYDWKVLGIRQATQGLMSSPPDFVPLDIGQTDGLLTAGGTVLGTTNKGNPFAFPMSDGSVRDRSDEIIDGYHQLGLDAMIGIGGDGSMAISIGFDTAVNIATEALDRLHFTAASHSRVMILEVMGRDAGHIAISAGIAGGADIILIPEIPYSVDQICQKIRDRQAQGKNYCLMIVAEAVRTEGGVAMSNTDGLGQCRLGGIGQYLAERICGLIGTETRVTALGHTQRGGTPSPLDRLVASAFGVAAVDLIAAGEYDRMVSWQNRQVVSVPITEAISQYRTVDLNGTLVKTARSLGICLGD